VTKKLEQKFFSTVRVTAYIFEKQHHTFQNKRTSFVGVSVTIQH